MSVCMSRTKNVMESANEIMCGRICVSLCCGMLLAGRDVLALVTNECSFCPMVLWPSPVPRETCWSGNSRCFFFFFFFLNPGFLTAKPASPHLRESVNGRSSSLLERNILAVEIVLCHWV